MRSLFALFALFALAYAGDCVGSYGSWGVCDGACGSQSTQNRFYSIQIPATAGGAPCPIAAGAFESRPCTVKCSTENCVGSWQTPSPCVSKGICGSDAGSQTRSYKVTRPTGPGGEDCPIADGTQETLACSAPITPCQGCEGYWTAWGACESEGRCGSDLGHQSRTYKITQQKAPGGADCPATDGQVATQRCSAAVTPCRGCSGHFEEPTACVSKGICDSAAGTHTKKYIVDVEAEAGGALCPYQNNQVVIEACSAPITPCVHCQGSWSAWSDCVSNGKCGSSAGKKKRTYTITQEAQNGGRSCEATNGQVQFGNCAAPITPCRGCSGSWSDFTECVSDGQCGSDAGTHKRTFTVTDPGEVGGAKCEATNGFVQTSPCAAPVTPCPAENCEGSFNGFSTCRAVSCGTTAGKQSRTFTVTKVAKYGGADCAHSNRFVETVDCEAPFTPCPVNCEGEFLAPVCVSNGVCDSPAGTQTEKYVISVKGANGGTNCPYADGYERKSACVAPITPCPPEDGEGQWSAWSECKAKSCGTTEGTYYATYHQTKAPKYGGKPCEAAEGQVRTAECVAVNTPCPVDCIGKFTEWTPCESKGICSNAAGTQKRTYEISQQAAHGGNACAHTHGQTEQQDCAATITPCPPEPCIGSWSEPTKCVQSKCDDNTGTNKQTFTVSKKARYGGTECEAENGDVRTNQCTVAAPIERCPIDCKGSYGEFTRCTPVHACGSTKGRRSRIYTIDVPAQFGGVRCPRADNSEEEEECKVDLVACPPINCVGHWTEPSACTQVDCDESDGVNSQQFIVTRAAAHGGVECSSKHGDVKQNNCTVDAEHLVRCPIACVGRWSAPTECEAIEECGCNKGTQQKTFEVVTKAEFGGAECPFVHEQKVTQKCLVPAHKVERCPNEILDAPCEDLRGLLTEAKATRCQLEAIVAALEAKK